MKNLVKGFYRVIKEKNYDIIQAVNKDIYSMTNGIVYGIGFDKLYKNYIVIYNDIEKSYIMYANFNKSLPFLIGEHINKGDKIGTMSEYGLKVKITIGCLCDSERIDFSDYTGLLNNGYLTDYLCLSISDSEHIISRKVRK